MTDFTPPKKTWFQVLTSCMFYTGIILLLFPLLMDVSNPTNILIITYSILTVMLAMITTSMYNRLSKKLSEIVDVTISTYFYHLLSMMGPILLLFAIVGYSLYLFIRYSKNINRGRTSEQYYTFSKISMALVIINFILLFNGIESKYFLENGRLEGTYSSGLYLTGVINAYVVMIMGYILASYTTDGFTGLE